MAGDTPTPRRTLYLVDGTYSVFRSFYAIARLSAPDGTPTNGVYGFLGTMRKLIRERCPDHLGVAFDLEGPTHRDGQYAEYKANRPALPPELAPQFELAMEATRAMGWPVLAAPGFEADDVLATLALAARDEGIDVVIVTSDKDLYQLVGPGIVVQNPAKEDRVLDAQGVAEVFGVPPENVVDVLALMGDAVDNVPGVPGIGEKTAKSLVVRYGGIDAVLERAGLFADLWEARQRALAALDASGSNGRELEEALAELKGPATLLAQLEEKTGDETGADLAARFSAAGALAPDTPPKQLRKALAELDKKTQAKTWLALAEHAAVARLSRDLVALRTDAPLTLDLDAMHARRPDYAQAADLFRRLGFRTLTEEIEAQGAAAAVGHDVPAVPGEEPQAETAPAEGIEVEVVDPAALPGRIGSLAPDETLAVATPVTAHELRHAALVGLGLASGRSGGLFVAGPALSGDWEAARSALGTLLANPRVPKTGHDLKRVRAALRRAGLALDGLAFDTMLAAQLLDPDRAAAGRLDDAATRFLGVAPAGLEETATGPRPLELTDPEVAARAAVLEAVTAARLVPVLRDALRRDDLLELFETVEMPLVAVLDDMESAGIRVDAARLAAMSAQLDRDLTALETEIHGLAGHPFNINSPPQLRAVLFDELQLTPSRRTQKTRVHSTGQEVLEALAEVHPLPAKVLDYRELHKLKGTYVDTLPRLVDPADGRVHTRFHQLGAATGRLSSSDPSLQNIPVRTPAGRAIRAAFVPEPGRVFLSADYSQMELRILAHLADDPQLIDAFARGLDIHRYTAALVAGIDIEAVTPELRAAAKAVNFGIVYGMSEYRLAREQTMTIEEARAFIAAYFARYPRIREYIDDTVGTVQRTGEVRTLFGRVRRFPELAAGEGSRLSRPAREAALRQAVNATVQGTGADIVKRAMVALHRGLAAERLAARLLLQVHDELLFEAPPDEVPRLETLVRRAMEGAARLSVPLKVDVRAAGSWAEAH